MKPKPIKISGVAQQPTISTTEIIRLWARLIKAGQAEQLEDEHAVTVESAVPEEPQEKAAS